VASRLAKPVTFPPGWLSSATMPLATGSIKLAKTIGIVRVSRWTAAVAGSPFVRMMSGCRPTARREHADAPHAVALLRARRERPRRCAAEECDQLASIHSITSSARASSNGGISSLIALVVFRLMTNSNRVASYTGRSAGFSPLRMRPV
jgi:hypothetical protein